jgi:lipopolysaccharide transport system permease protein
MGGIPVPGPHRTRTFRPTGSRMIQHLAAIWRFRFFWASLVRLDLQNRYRRSALGIGWSLLHPLAMTVVFCMAFGGVMHDGKSDWRSYSLHLLSGLAVWGFIQGSMLQGCEAFIRAEAYIRQCPLPFAIYPLRTVLGTLIHFMIALGMVVVAVVLLGDKPDAGLTALTTVVYTAPAVLMCGVFCWSVATLFAFANVFFQDTKHLTDVCSQLFFFLSPIVYPAKLLVDQGLGVLLTVNPVAHFLELFRATLLTGEPAPLEMYLWCGGFTAAAFGLAVGAMAWLQRKVIFYL